MKINLDIVGELPFESQYFNLCVKDNVDHPDFLSEKSINEWNEELEKVKANLTYDFSYNPVLEKIALLQSKAGLAKFRKFLNLLVDCHDRGESVVVANNIRAEAIANRELADLMVEITKEQIENIKDLFSRCIVIENVDSMYCPIHAFPVDLLRSEVSYVTVSYNFLIANLLSSHNIIKYVFHGKDLTAEHVGKELKKASFQSEVFDIFGTPIKIGDVLISGNSFDPAYTLVGFDFDSNAIVKSIKHRSYSNIGIMNGKLFHGVLATPDQMDMVMMMRLKNGDQ